MNLEKTVERHDVAISNLKDDMTSITTNITVLINEQKHVTESLKKIESKVFKIDHELVHTQKKLTDIQRYSEFKKEFVDKLISYLRIGAIAGPLLIGALTYAAYDWGLYKPAPNRISKP